LERREWERKGKGKKRKRERILWGCEMLGGKVARGREKERQIFFVDKVKER
jgi:hypothetical protein